MSAFGAVNTLAQLLSRWLGDPGLSRERATLQRFGEELGRDVLAVALAADFIHEAGFSGFPLYDANGDAGPDAEVHALLLAREEIDEAPTLTVPLHMIESVNTR